MKKKKKEENANQASLFGPKPKRFTPWQIKEDVEEFYEERAAIGEHERGMSRADAEASAKLLADARYALLVSM